MWSRPSTGTAAATSLPRQPRRCAAFSSIRPAASWPTSTAAASYASNFPRTRRPRRLVPTTSLALDEALSRLECHDPDAARLVKLRYFAGLSHQDAAEALGISRGAADRLWALGRAWLFRQLSK